MLEYEKKILLKKSEYELLCDYFSDCETVFQTNYYYDTKNYDFNHSGITLRIRKKGDDYIATEKQHSKFNGDLSRESNYIVDNAFDTTPFSGMNVEFKGALSTERKVCMPFEGIKISLDKSIYFNETDYEVEIEYTAENSELCKNAVKLIAAILEYTDEKALSNFQKRINISGSKSERFFRIKKQK